ncbi:MAG TPA: heme o synthase [Methylomirabilota bacterium]|nr:heme o synthase [Methylomirabilota bacterium]
MTSRTEAIRTPTSGGARALALVGDRRRLLDFVALTKPRVVLMILVTASVGYYLGAPEQPDYGLLVHMLVGTGLAAAGTMALNQFLERDVDARMRRTRGRPLPDGRLAPLDACVFGVLVTVTGLAYLGVTVGALGLLVTAVTAILYLFAYTPLKRVTPLCMVLGAVPGALPPVTGWVSARGELGLGAGVLFAILFLWQLPHTLAIARLYRDDYAQAGIQVLPVVDPDGASTERQIVAGCLALHAVGLLPTLVGLAGSLYFFGAFVLGGVFLAYGMAQALAPSRAAARRVMLFSVLYLPLLLGLMALDKVG